MDAAIRQGLSIFGSVLHCLSLGLNAKSLHVIWGTKRRASLVFWILSTVAVALLVASSLTELAFMANRFWPSIWPWSPLLSMQGDVLARLAIIVLAILRFWRLSLLLSKWGKCLMAVFGALVILPMTATLILGIMVRSQEYANFIVNPNGSWRSPYLIMLRGQESTTALVSALIALSLSIGADVFFFRIITTRTRQKRKVPFKPYAAAILVNFIYLISFLLGQLNIVVVIKSFTITFARFAPTIEAYVFFTVTIPRSRRLLQSRRMTSSIVGLDEDDVNGSKSSADTEAAHSIMRPRFESNAEAVVSVRTRAESNRHLDHHPHVPMVGIGVAGLGSGRVGGTALVAGSSSALAVGQYK